MSARTPEMLRRDLIAFCEAPNLLRTSPQRPMTNPCLGMELATGLDMTNFPKNRQRKLGLYAEDLLVQWLSLASDYALVAHDLVIQGAQRTLGALDFIVDTPSGTEHWELALKFYLGVGGSDWEHWVGPSIKDSLYKKMTRVDQHQLKLSDHPIAKQRLAEHGIIQPVKAKFMLKGMFFTPWGKEERPMQCAEDIKLGQWLTQSKISELEAFPGMWGIVERQNWISGYTSVELTANDLKQICLEQPIMIAQNVAYSEDHDHRIFLVPDSWENRAQNR